MGAGEWRPGIMVTVHVHQAADLGFHRREKSHRLKHLEAPIRFTGFGFRATSRSILVADSSTTAFSPLTGIGNKCGSGYGLTIPPLGQRNQAE